MADTSTLESISELLPVERRERFLQLVARFQSVPNDDEFLLILEAIGFMTLLYKEVPDEIAKILAGANPTNETHEGLSKLVKEAVCESIPSYEDLKRISECFENHELALKQALQSQKKSNPSQNNSGLLLITIFIVGGALGYGLSLLTL